jgi:methionyl-tRNA synthetase
MLIFFIFRSRAGTVVSFCCNIAALICVLIQPYMPHTSEVMAKQLNLPADCFIIPEYFVPFLAPGHKIGKV